MFIVVVVARACRRLVQVSWHVPAYTPGMMMARYLASTESRQDSSGADSAPSGAHTLETPHPAPGR